MSDYIIVKREDLEKAIAHTKTGNYFKAGEQLLKAFNNAQPAEAQKECDCCGYPGHSLEKYRKLLQEMRPAEGRELSIESAFDLGFQFGRITTSEHCEEPPLRCPDGEHYIKRRGEILSKATADTEQPSESERRKIKLKITSRRNLEPMPIEDEAEQEQPITAQEASVDEIMSTIWKGVGTTHEKADAALVDAYRLLSKFSEQAAQDREDAISEASIAALLPDSYYMDPPDGGDVSITEQLRRMAKDAERYRWLRNDALAPDMLDAFCGDELDQQVDEARQQERQAIHLASKMPRARSE